MRVIGKLVDDLLVRMGRELGASSSVGSDLVGPYLLSEP